MQEVLKLPTLAHGPCRARCPSLCSSSTLLFCFNTFYVTLLTFFTWQYVLILLGRNSVLCLLHMLYKTEVNKWRRMQIRRTYPRFLCFALSLSFWLSFSKQWHQPFSSYSEWCPVTTTEIQQWSCLFHVICTNKSTVASHLWCSAAQQVKTLSHHSATIWQWHLTWDWGEGSDTCSSTGGKYSITVNSCLSIWLKTEASREVVHISAHSQSCSNVEKSTN